MAIEHIGTVTRLIGTATAIDDQGNERPLQSGDKVYPNETIQTGDQSVIEIRLIDGSYVDLGRDSEITLDSDLYNEDAITYVQAVQAAIEAGEDPSKITPPPAAPPPQENDGADFVNIPYEDPRATPESGFETTGITVEFREPDEDFLLQPEEPTPEPPPQPTPAIAFNIQASPAQISEVNQESATFTISRTGGTLEDGIQASVQVTAPFEDGDGVDPATGNDTPGQGDYNQTLSTAIATAAAATDGVTFDPLNGILTFTGSTIQLEFTVTAVDDETTEGTEDIVAHLSNAQLTNGTATIGTDTANVDIIDDDGAPPPQLAIDDQTVTEGVDSTITFTVTRTGDNGAPSTVNYTVNPGSAVTPDDYTASDPLSGTLTFATGETTQTITLDITDDLVPEDTEQFTVDLSGETNAVITDDQGIGTILDPNPLNGSIITNPNLDGQRAILTFVDQSDPIKSYSKSFNLGTSGEPNFIVDSGFNVDPSVDYLVALEDDGSLALTILNSFTLEGVTIHDSSSATPPFTLLGIDETNTSSIQYGLTTVISPDNATLLQAETLSTDGSGAVDNITDAGNDGFTYIFGVSDDDTLTGSIESDLLNGGSGADTVQGNGGDDILVFDGNDTVLDGGSGTDLLRIDNDADLRNNSAINDIEALLITDDDNSDPNTGLTITLDAQDVLNFTDTDNILFIRGNDGDQADLGNEFVTDGSSNADGFVTYTATVSNTMVSVLIEDSITVI